MLTIEFKSSMTKRQILDAIFVACRADAASMDDCELILSATEVVDDHTATISLNALDDMAASFVEGVAITLSDGHIYNLTQHSATAEQIAQGVVEPQNKKEITDLLTFTGLPSKKEILQKAELLASKVWVAGYSQCMIGGALWLMGPLEEALKKRGIQPLYAYSVRNCVEEELPDGSIKKTMVFKHLGFIEA